MVVVPLARVLVWLLPMPTVALPLYFVPLTVTSQDWEAEALICPYSLATSSSFQEMVVLLFSTDWLTVDQLNLRESQEVTATLLLPLIISATYLLNGQSPGRPGDHRKITDLQPLIVSDDDVAELQWIAVDKLQSEDFGLASIKKGIEKLKEIKNTL
jgi:hypothetical protein